MARPALIVALVALGGFARAETPPLTAAERQHRFACVCEMCNRRPLDDCQCDRAAKMRIQLGLLVAQLGADEAAIDAAMAGKYSAAVLSPIAEPHRERDVPWLGPLVLGMLGAGIAWRIVKTRRQRHK